MVEWLTVIVAVVGTAIVVAIPAALWAMVVYGLIQSAQENTQT